VFAPALTLRVELIGRLFEAHVFQEAFDKLPTRVHGFPLFSLLVGRQEHLRLDIDQQCGHV
jgi:hypothetical protein